MSAPTKNQGVGFLQTVAADYMQKLSGTDVVDVIHFAQAGWGLNLKLLPAQKFILSAYYGLPLDNSNQDIPVYNDVRSKLLYRFTQEEFMRYLIEDGRCNLTKYEPGKAYRELVLCCGRRGSKCRYVEDVIATTVGSISFRELHQRISAGEEIGLLTYDPVTLKQTTSYGIKTELNRSECYRIETKRGIIETSSWNHPYLVWRDDWEKPRMVEANQLLLGDRIATSSSVGLFGKGGIGVNKAALLGHLQGDGGTTETATYTTASEVMLNDFKRCIAEDFPDYNVNKLGKAAWRLGYRVVKKSGKKMQNGSKKNEVIEWLISVGCFGKKSTIKTVPECIMKGNREEVVTFLSRLYGCDGHVSIEKKGRTITESPKCSIGYCSASKELVDGVRHLLLKFGIHGVVRKQFNKCNGKLFPSWTLNVVEKEGIDAFHKHISILSKESKLAEAATTAGEKNNPNNEFIGVPKGIWTYFKRIKEERNLQFADFTGERGRPANKRIKTEYSPSRRKVESYGDNVGDTFLKDMGTSDVLWDSIEVVDPVGMKDTVDVEVPGTHIIGGDLVSHNSTLSSIIANYEVYRLVKMGNPQDYFGFPLGQEICITCVATSDQQAGVLFGMIRDRSLVCEYIKDRIVHSTQNYFNLQTDNDINLYGKRKKSSISVFCGGCSSIGLRGHNNIVVIMDEEAFFLDNEGRFSGDEVYRALTPSIATFVPKKEDGIYSEGDQKAGEGKILNLSSPYGKYGIFWDNYNRSFQDTENMLMFKMYTAMINPDVDAAFLKTEKRRNPITFQCEYGAEFSDRITSWIDNTEKFSQCVNTKVTTNQRTGKVGVEYFMGIDPGFVNDGTGIAIVYSEDGKIHLAWADVFYSGVSDIWDYPSGIYRNQTELAGYDMLPVTEIVNKIGMLCKQFPVKSGWFDQHQGYSMVDLLHRAGMTQFRTENVSSGLNAQISQLVKQLIMDGMIVLFDHPVLIPEMLGMQQEKKGGGFIVRASPKPGAHDDLTSAYMRAVWECYNSCLTTSKAVSIAFGGGMSYGSHGMNSSNSAMRHRSLQHGAPPRMVSGRLAKMQARRSIYGR